jgi:hypothetical protein
MELFFFLNNFWRGLGLWCLIVMNSGSGMLLGVSRLFEKYLWIKGNN